MLIKINSDTTLGQIASTLLDCDEDEDDALMDEVLRFLRYEEPGEKFKEKFKEKSN